MFFPLGKMDDFGLKLDLNWVNRGGWIVFRHVLFPGISGVRVSYSPVI
jgi:hypothetical protein